MQTTTTTTRRLDGWLRHTEADLEAHMQAAAESAAVEAERRERDEAFVAAFCLSGHGHDDIDYTEGEYVPADATLTGMRAEIMPAFAECLTCGTVLR